MPCSDKTSCQFIPTFGYWCRNLERTCIIGFGLYLFGVVSSYAASTIYHAIPASRASSKAIARKLDNAAIFWHIAASYSPLTLIGMRLGGEPVWAWVIFGIVWLAAIVGTSLSFRKMKRQSYLETACYVLMGHTILIAFKPFYDSCGLAIVLWVVGEGIAYITGARSHIEIGAFNLDSLRSYADQLHPIYL